MNAPAVAIAVSSTMFTSPIKAAPPKIVPLDTSSPPVLPPALVSRSPTLLFSLLHTPMPPSTRYRNATAIIQTKNSATDNTSDTFSVLHGSIRRICMLARPGPLCRLPTCVRPEAEGRLAGSDAGRCSEVALRGCACRGAGPDKSGSSLAYVSGRTVSVRSPNGAASWSCAGAPDPPAMKRFSRASTPALWPPSGACRCGWRLAPAGPRCQGGTSLPPRGDGLPGEPLSVDDGPPPEPLALPGASPVRGYPGSFGELTYGSLAVSGLGDRVVGGLVFLGVTRNGNQCVALTQVHQANTLGLPPGLANLASRRPDDAPTGSDGVQLCVVI